MRIPRLPAWRGYRDAITLRRILGGGTGRGAFAVTVRKRGARLSRLRTQNVVLYVQPKRVLGRRSKEVQVLEKYSPWTRATLPFTPKKSEAQLVSRRVSRDEVDAITKKRTADRKVWQAELSRAGVPSARRAKIGPSANPGVVVDTYLEASRLEFGAGGTRPKPHWRPALRGLASRGILGIIRRRTLGRRRLEQALTAKTFSDGLRWVPRLPTISGREVQLFAAFARKISSGISSRRAP